MIIALDSTWLVYITLSLSFVDGIICIWTLKLIIEHGYEHKYYLSYILFRIVSITIVMSMICGISISQMVGFPNNLDSKQTVLKYYFICTLCLISILMCYIIISSVIYSFHMSVVKEFYTIVGIIIEAHLNQKKEHNAIEIAQPIPHFCIGVPFFESGQEKGKDITENSFELSMKDAKFEVEIELQNNDGSDEIKMEKIKVFQCDSESSSEDSYRIKPISCMESKKKSQKIPRGRRLTFQDDDFFHNKNKLENNSNIIISSSKCIGNLQPDVIEEEDDKYGLDFLEEYNSNHKTVGEKGTAFTSDGEMVYSPVSKHSFKKRVSIKQVSRRQSFTSQNSIKKRRFTIAEEKSDDS